MAEVWLPRCCSTCMPVLCQSPPVCVCVRARAYSCVAVEVLEQLIFSHFLILSSLRVGCEGDVKYWR